MVNVFILLRRVLNGSQYWLDFSSFLDKDIWLISKLLLCSRIKYATYFMFCGQELATSIVYYHLLVVNVVFILDAALTVVNLVETI